MEVCLSRQNRPFPHLPTKKGHLPPSYPLHHTSSRGKSSSTTRLAHLCFCNMPPQPHSEDGISGRKKKRRKKKKKKKNRPLTARQSAFPNLSLCRHPLFLSLFADSLADSPLGLTFFFPMAPLPTLQRLTSAFPMPPHTSPVARSLCPQRARTPLVCLDNASYPLIFLSFLFELGIASISS